MLSRIRASAQAVASVLKSEWLERRAERRLPVEVPRPEDERIRRMQALAALRGATFADTRKWTSTDSLRRGLRWDRNTTSRVLAFHESKGLVAIDPEQYIFGQKVYLTAAGIEEVEWSILHPTEDRSDRAAWIVNLLPLVDALLKLPTTVVDDMLRNLGSTDRLSRESVEREMQVVGGDDARRAVLALLRDPCGGIDWDMARSANRAASVCAELPTERCRRYATSPSDRAAASVRTGSRFGGAPRGCVCRRQGAARRPWATEAKCVSRRAGVERVT